MKTIIKFIKWVFTHQCVFKPEDVINLNIDPKCVYCDKKLSESGTKSI